MSRQSLRIVRCGLVLATLLHVVDAQNSSAPSPGPALPPGSSADLDCFVGVNIDPYRFLERPLATSGARYCIAYKFKCPGAGNTSICSAADAAAGNTVTVHEAASPARLSVLLADSGTFTDLRISNMSTGVWPLAPFVPPPAATDVLCWTGTAALVNGVVNYTAALSTERTARVRWCVWYDYSCRTSGMTCNAGEVALGYRRFYAGLDESALYGLQSDLRFARDFGICTSDGCNAPASIPPAAPIRAIRCMAGNTREGMGSFVLGMVVNVSASIVDLPAVAGYYASEVVPGGLCFNATVTCVGSTASTVGSRACRTMAPEATAQAPVTINTYGYCATPAACRMMADADPSLRSVRVCSISAPSSSVYACNAPDNVNAASAAAAASTLGPSSCFGGDVAVEDDGRAALGTEVTASFNNTNTRVYNDLSGTQVVLRSTNLFAGPRECFRIVYSCWPSARGFTLPACTSRDIALGLNRVLYGMNPRAYPQCAALSNAVLGPIFTQGVNIVSCTACNSGDNCNVQSSPSTMPSPSASPSTGASQTSSPSAMPSTLPPVQDWPASCHFGVVSSGSVAAVVNRTLTQQERVAGTRCASFMRVCTTSEASTASCTATGMVWVYGVVSSSVCTAFARRDMMTLAASSFNGTRLSCCNSIACNTPQATQPSASPAPSAASSISAIVVSTTLRFISGTVNVRDLISDRARLTLRQVVAAALRVLADNVTITAVRDEAGALLFSANTSAVQRPRNLQGAQGGVEVDTSIATSDVAVAGDVQSNVVGTSFASIITSSLRTAAATSTDVTVQSAFLGANVASVAPAQVTTAYMPSPSPAAAADSAAAGASTVIIIAVIVPVVVLILIAVVALVCMRQGAGKDAAKRHVLGSPSSTPGGVSDREKADAVVLENVAFSGVRAASKGGSAV